LEIFKFLKFVFAEKGYGIAEFDIDMNFNIDILGLVSFG
jgi:hypothetical protein